MLPQLDTQHSIFCKIKEWFVNIYLTRKNICKSARQKDITIIVIYIGGMLLCFADFYLLSKYIDFFFILLEYSILNRI